MGIEPLSASPTAPPGLTVSSAPTESDSQLMRQDWLGRGPDPAGRDGSRGKSLKDRGRPLPQYPLPHLDLGWCLFPPLPDPNFLIWKMG